MKRLSASSRAGLASVLIVAAVLIPSASRAGEIVSLHAQALHFTAASSYLEDDDGSRAWSTTVAVRELDGTARITIRICQDPLRCDEFAKNLDASEFVIGSNANVAQIATMIAGLGDVALTSYSHSFPATFSTCPNDETRSLLVATGSPVANAGFAYGGRLGPWTVKGGGCGFNGVKGVVIWLRP